MNTPVIDAFGNMRFCEPVYGPAFGNIIDDDFDIISQKREEWFDIINIYEIFGHTYTALINELALKDNVDLDKYYRRYCAMNITTLFRHFNDSEELISSLETIFSNTHPLNLAPEIYEGFDLTIIQKRVLQEIRNMVPELLLDEQYSIHHISKILPEKLLNKIKIDSFYELFNDNPVKINENILNSVRYILDSEHIENIILVINQDKEQMLEIIEEAKIRYLA